MMENIKVVLSEQQIQTRVKELAKKISEDFQDKDPIMICMLKGAIYFFADLTRNLTIPVQIDFAHLSSYKNGTTSGVMEIISNITSDIKNRHIIIVEDIIDSGKTLDYFVRLIKEKNPASISICAFLDKKERREIDVKVDYVGFDIPCGFVVGYGMDYAQHYRELPYLGELTDVDNL